MDTVWTLDGDENSWSNWADQIAQVTVSPWVQRIIAAHRTERDGWAVDLGCGTGRAFFPLANAGYRVIGIDPIITGVRIGRQQAQQFDILAFPVLGSAARLPLPDNSVSLVFAMSCLFHLSYAELMEALSEACRVLRADGKAVLHFLDSEDWRCSLAKRIQPEQSPCPSYRAVVTCFCSQEQIQAWLTHSGLKITRLELKTSESKAGQQRNWIVECHK